MNHYRTFFSFGLMMIFCTSAAAYDIQQGIHGMNWGSSISEYNDLTKVHESDQAAYYANSNMLYQVANQPVPGVFYGFYRDQFFAVFIKLRSPHQFSHLKRQFSIKYGSPKTTLNAKSQQTVYRWKDADVKIKLKMKESSGEYKLAFYYSPLAAKLNEEQLERIPTDAFGPTPSKKDKTVKPAPLLNF
jgi:hypothetical protein